MVKFFSMVIISWLVKLTIAVRVIQDRAGSESIFGQPVFFAQAIFARTVHRNWKSSKSHFSTLNSEAFVQIAKPGLKSCKQSHGSAMQK